MQNHNDLHNPDVLNCLANLSNDEVFTPPRIANQMLDLLPQEIWSNKEAKFLDPFCKSGVFLREIAKRITKYTVSVLLNSLLYSLVEVCIVQKILKANTVSPMFLTMK